MSATKLAELLIGSGRPDHARVVDGGRVLDRRQVEHEAARLTANLKRAGVRRGQKVMALLDNDVQGLLFLAAASAIGLHVYMPYNLRSAAVAEWKMIAASAQPDFVVHLRRNADTLAELRALRPTVITRAEVDASAGTGAGTDVEVDSRLRIEHPDPVPGFLVLFSSGTTGNPKAISVSEDLVVRRVRGATDAIGLGPESRALMTGLLNNTTGVIFCFGSLMRGATLVFPRSPAVEDWPAEVAEHAVTHLMLRPVALRRFIDAVASTGADLSSLQTMAYGAAAVPVEVLERGRRLIPCAWVQGYGLSETYGPFCWLDEPGHAQRRYRDDRYCVGRPDGTLTVRIEPSSDHTDGIGEVLLRGEDVMDGYLDLDTGRLHGGDDDWLRTGDLGRFSAAGDLILKGRVHGSVLSENGHRIYPEEVEATLAGMPGVDSVVVVAAQRSDTSTPFPVACLFGPLGSRPRDEVEALLASFLTSRLSREKWPDYVHVTADPPPIGVNGKVARNQVAASISKPELLDVRPHTGASGLTSSAAAPIIPSSERKEMITLVNTFEVVDGRAEEFERAFQETAAFLTVQPGFLGYHLVRSQLTPSKYFNFASWASMAELQAALGRPEMRDHHEGLMKLASTDPHPCQTVITRSLDGSGADLAADRPG